MGLTRAVGPGEAAAAEVAFIAADVKVIDVFEQIGNKEESVDFVLMLGGFGELVDLIGASFKFRRIVVAEMPRSERRLRERLLGAGSIVLSTGLAAPLTGSAEA